MENHEQIFSIVIGLLLIFLGCSFAVKFFQAASKGKVVYWSGFLPLSVISPLFTHQAAKENTLIKETTGLWVHLVLAPIFLIVSSLMLAVGCDLLGLHGTDTLNFILNGGNQQAPLAITYDKKYKMSFPILTRFGRQLSKVINAVALPDQDRK